jgi:hypothetical protein
MTRACGKRAFDPMHGRAAIEHLRWDSARGCWQCLGAVWQHVDLNQAKATGLATRKENDCCAVRLFSNTTKKNIAQRSRSGKDKFILSRASL